MTLDFTLAQPKRLAEAGAVPAPMTEAEFAAFHARTAAPLLAYLRRASGNHALAQDVAQEAYMRFLNSCRWSEGEVVCRRFLFTVASNLLRDHWRRREPGTLEEVPEAALAGAGADSGAERLIAQWDAEAALAPGWASLRPRERQLLWLAYVEGYNHREMAEITGLRQASMRMLLFRARRKLAATLRAATC
ncbi:MAG TPA: sigma-70 family RNA polymerase sigma factor [Terriglobales bacterium]|nr:sigma-70 family RNA polymerase sigma factor [Terriglobales bacterium]